MFGSTKKTMRKDGVTMELEVTSDASGSPVVKVKITDKKNRRIVVDTPFKDIEVNTMPGGVYC